MTLRAKQTERLALDASLTEPCTIRAWIYVIAESWSAFGTLQFGAGPFAGHRTYPIAAFDSGASASLRSAQGVEYDTRRFGGRGQIVLTDHSCRTYTGTDPVTGIHGTWRLCTVAGTFEFTAKSESGDSVVVTRGRFRATG